MASGELVSGIAYFHRLTTPTTLTSLLTAAATLAAIAAVKDVGFTAVRHYLASTLHRKWREWLDRSFNDALLDANHTHFHVQQMGTEGAGSAIPAPDNVDQRVQESIKGLTGGALGLAMGILGVILSLGFVGSKLLETSTEVRGLEFLGSTGMAFLTFAAIAIYVPINTLVAAKLGSILQRLSVRMQWAEGSYRTELNTLLHRSFHVAALRSEGGQKSVNRRRYQDIDQTWASLNWINAGYMGFELVYNFMGSRFVAYAPGLLPYVDNKISLQTYITGAELANALINACSWFIHVMPDIATLRANARRITDLARAIEAVQQPEEFYAQTGPNEFHYAPQEASRGLTVKQAGTFPFERRPPLFGGPKTEFPARRMDTRGGEVRQREDLAISRIKRSMGSRPRHHPHAQSCAEPLRNAGRKASRGLVERSGLPSRPLRQASGQKSCDCVVQGGT